MCSPWITRIPGIPYPSLSMRWKFFFYQWRTHLERPHFFVVFHLQLYIERLSSDYNLYHLQDMWVQYNVSKVCYLHLQLFLLQRDLDVPSRRSKTPKDKIMKYSFFYRNLGCFNFSLRSVFSLTLANFH